MASIPVALLVALILYVNEIPDRRGDARAGKRTLPVRFSRTTVVIAATTSRSSRRTSLVVVGVVAGMLPIPTLLVLLTIPLALQVSRGLAPELRQPVRPDGDHGREHQAAPRGGAAALVAAYLVVLVASSAVAPSVAALRWADGAACQRLAGQLERALVAAKRGCSSSPGSTRSSS